jgi:hypothetical protein
MGNELSGVAWCLRILLFVGKESSARLIAAAQFFPTFPAFLTILSSCGIFSNQKTHHL